MTHPEIMELVKQGNAKAIATALNDLLQDTGITARATLKDECLQVVLESAQVPEQQSAVAFICQMMQEWEVESINFVRVYGQESGQSFSRWVSTISLSELLEEHRKNVRALKSSKQTVQWPAWFPYPSSWLRAFVLLLITFPLTSLIVFRLNIISFSSIISSYDVLLIFSGYWLILPTLILSLTNHFFWLLGQVISFKRLSNFSKSFNGIWEGFYGTAVITISFLVILNILAAFFVFSCSLSGETAESLVSCIGREFGQATWSIFDSIENFWNEQGDGVVIAGRNGFAIRPWFVIWFVIAAYLYQVEYLIRRHFTTKQLTKGLWLGFFAVLLAAGIALFSKWPETTKGIPLPVASQTPARERSKPIALMPTPILPRTPLPVPYAPATVIPSKIQIKAPPPLPPLDPFPEALNKAKSAAKLSKSAKSQNEWNLAASQWQEASALMEAVPASSPNYPVAQQKAVEYQQNFAEALKAATTRFQ